MADCIRFRSKHPRWTQVERRGPKRRDALKRLVSGALNAGLAKMAPRIKGKKEKDVVMDCWDVV